MFLSLKSAEGPCSKPWSYASSIPFPSLRKLLMLAFKDSLSSKFALPHFKLILAHKLGSPVLRKPLSDEVNHGPLGQSAFFSSGAASLAQLRHFTHEKQTEPHRSFF